MTQCVIISPGRAPLDTALAGLPGRCDGAVVDTRSEADVAALFARAGELDHLVYSAGDALGPRPLKDLSLDEARQLFEVRFWGAVAAVKHAAPRVRPGGSIVLTSGTVGVRPAPGGALAASGASAIEGLTRGLAVELAPIRVNAVRPGVIRTPMWGQIPEPQRETLFATLAERTLTKEIGEPDQIAATHLYLPLRSFSSSRLSLGRFTSGHRGTISLRSGCLACRVYAERRHLFLARSLVGA